MWPSASAPPGGLVREGRALVYLPDPSRASTGRGLEPAWLSVFYNPRMVFNRDLSVAALSVYALWYARVEGLCVAEPLTATGVRSVRYALEVPGVECVQAGDIDPAAVEFARLNARANRVEGIVRVSWADARELLHAGRRERGAPFHVVDLDPFGSPAPFLDAALASLGHGGLLAATATDLAVLEGSKPRAALRRYAARVVKTPESKEVGLRVLVGYAARVAAAHDRAVRPLMAYYADHYYRVYLLVERGARRADRMLSACLGELTYCPGDRRTYVGGDAACHHRSRSLKLGPAWLCQLNDPQFLARLSEALRGEYSYLETAERAARLVVTLAEEAPLEERRLHLLIEQAAAAARTSMPKTAELLDALRGAGYEAVRSHYSPTAVRTNAPYSEVIRLLSSRRARA